MLLASGPPANLPPPPPPPPLLPHLPHPSPLLPPPHLTSLHQQLRGLVAAHHQQQQQQQQQQQRPQLPPFLGLGMMNNNPNAEAKSENPDASNHDDEEINVQDLEDDSGGTFVMYFL